MITSESTNEIFKALIEAAPEIKALVKSKRAYEYKYATLDSLIDMLRAVLPAHGLWFLQTTSNADDEVLKLTTRVIHTSGEWIEDSIVFEKTDLTKGRPNDTQKIGAAITYFRRYALAAVFAVASDDDVDGNADAAPEKTQPKPKQSPIDFIQKNIMDRMGAGETYDGILKHYSELLHAATVKEPGAMTETEQRDLANAIYKWRKGNGK